MKNNLTAWPKRPWILTIFLALAGFAFYLIIDEKIFGVDHGQLRIALATFICVGAIAFAFALERIRLFWVVIFSLTWALILALVAHSTISFQTGDFGFPFFSGLLAAGIALPLFQTIHKHGKLELPYKDLHAAAWSDTICWCASWVFVGLSFSLAFLLASLFDLIGIGLLKELLKEEWFIWTFMGANFGAALGVLKENDRIVSSLQNLVMTILSILAPVFCLSLVLFLLALPFTGLQPFWDATRGTTPILLSCAVGAIVLVNAIIRNDRSEESAKRIMRYSAIGLSLCTLPLAAIAFVSMQQRISQYGFTPDRIWGMLGVLVGLAYGTAYVWSIIRKCENWSSNLRANNTRIAIFLCVTALFLALPIVNFSKISVTSQLSRIETGRIQPEKIDYAAFAFDFGDAGRSALEKMQKSENEIVANRATLALAVDNRWTLDRKVNEANSALVILSKLSVFPKPVSLPDALERAINKHGGCVGEYCALVWEQGANTAQFVTSSCPNHSWRSEVHRADEGYQYCPPIVTAFSREGDEWRAANHYAYQVPSGTTDQKNGDTKAVSDAIRQGQVEIRTVERKQIFIGGKPVGEAY